MSRFFLWELLLLLVLVIGGGWIVRCCLVPAPPEPEPINVKECALFSLFDKPLNEKQQEHFAQIKGMKTTVDLIVVKYYPDCMGVMPLRIPLNQHTVFIVDKYRWKINDDDNGARVINWKAGKDAVVLSFTGQNVTGLVYADNRLFAVEPLGDGLQAVSEVDQTKFPKD